MNFYGDSVVVVHAPLTTGGWGGQQVRDWANATRTTVSAAVQARSVTEQATGREIITTDKRVHLGGAVAITEVDRVEWRGGTYEVTGVEPHFQQGRMDHLEVTMTLWQEPSA